MKRDRKLIAPIFRVGGLIYSRGREIAIIRQLTTSIQLIRQLFSLFENLKIANYITKSTKLNEKSFQKANLNDFVGDAA